MNKNHLRVTGLLALAATALAAFAATASATQLTSPTGTTYATGSTLKAVAGVTKWTSAFVTVECESTLIQGSIASQGTGVTVKATLSTFDFNVCNFAFTVRKTGTLELHAIGTGAEREGTITSSGAEIEVQSSLGTCIFTTSATDIGTFTGGKTASIDINGTIPRTAGNFLCGSSAVWEGSALFTTPDELWLDS